MGASDGIATEARDLVRRAAGEVAGKTVAAQIRQAARHLGYTGDDWRVREAWYGRAGAWSAAAVDDLRRRCAEWREAEAKQAAPAGLARRLTAVRTGLARLDRDLADIEVEVARLSGVAGRGGDADA